MLPVPLAHLPSWSQPLLLLISQTDSSLPAAPSRPPGAMAPPRRQPGRPAASARRFLFRPRITDRPEQGENVSGVGSVRSSSDRFSTWLRVRVHTATCTRGPPSASVTAGPCLRAALNWSRLSAVCQKSALPSPPRLIFY